MIPPLTPHHQLRYVDSHVHLDRYSDGDVVTLLARAAQAGVAALLTVGVDLPASQRAITLAERFGAQYGVYAAVGLHPVFLAAGDLISIDRALEQIGLIVQSARERIVAIGEIGLDTHDAAVALDMQAYAFTAQLELANGLGLPVVIHTQGAEAIAQAQALYATTPARLGAVVHYFVGDRAEARRWLDLGCHISVGKPVSRVEHTNLRAAIASPDLPIERLLIETDTYPTPGRTTEPADVVAVADEVATLKGLPREQIARQTTNNFMRLFRLIG